MKKPTSCPLVGSASNPEEFERRIEHNRHTPDEQAEQKYVIGTGVDLSEILKVCPSGTVLVGESLSLDSQVVVQLRCKRWGCPSCGRRRITHLTHRITDAAPSKFITLTVNPQFFESPRNAFERTSPKIQKLVQRIRRNYGTFEFVRVTEVTKKGWPHYHLMAISKFIPQARLSQWWAELTGASIVDIRTIKKAAHVYKYVLKYLSKQKYIPWTNRRVSWSRGFFPKKPKKTFPTLDLVNVDRYSRPLDQYLAESRDGWEMQRYTDDCWKVRLVNPVLPRNMRHPE